MAWRRNRRQAIIWTNNDPIHGGIYAALLGDELIRKIQDNVYTLTWASVHWLVQCILECHWNATGWLSVHWDTTGWPNEVLQGTLEHHWENLIETVPHWNATGEILTCVFAVAVQMKSA